MGECFSLDYNVAASYSGDFFISCWIGFSESITKFF